jgi:Ca2+-binding EF-hand superfamily protein
MKPLYTSTALALMLALGTAAQAAGTKTESGQQQATQQQQAAQGKQTSQQQTQQQDPTQRRQMQARSAIDTNNDGRISQEEAQAHHEQVFSSFDRDGDGKLSRDEIAGIVAVEPGYVVITRMIPVALTADVGSQAFSEMDQDRNQQISRQEYMQYGEQQFKRAQEQAGGKLSTAESQMRQQQTGQAQTGQQQQTGQAQTGQQQAGQAQTQAQTGQQQQAGQQQAQQGQSEAQGRQEVVRWREADVDRDGDGIVTADEAAAAWVETFHQLDRNGDDQLSQDELDQMRAQRAMIDRRFAELDADGDGQIGMDEYASAGHDLMDFADLDNDGEVTAWEYRAVRVTDR